MAGSSVPSVWCKQANGIHLQAVRESVIKELRNCSDCSWQRESAGWWCRRTAGARWRGTRSLHTMWLRGIARAGVARTGMGLWAAPRRACPAPVRSRPTPCTPRTLSAELAPDLGRVEVQLRRGAWLVRPDRCRATAPAALGLARAASYSTVPGQPPQQQPGLTMEMALSISNATFMQLDKGLQGGHLDQIRVRGHRAAPRVRAGSPPRARRCLNLSRCVCRRLALGRRWPAAGRRCSTCT